MRDIQDKFKAFPEGVKRQLVGAISQQSATASGMKTQVSFNDHIQGLPDPALEWLLRFETELLE